MSEIKRQVSDSANTLSPCAPTCAFNTASNVAHPLTSLLATIVCVVILSLATAVSPSKFAAMDELSLIESIQNNADEPHNDTLELAVTPLIPYDVQNQFAPFQCASQSGFCAMEHHSSHSPRAPPNT